MSISGNFVDFSLPELLQFLDQGKKTGILHIELPNHQNGQNGKQTHYIWLHQGRVIAAGDRLDGQGLTLMISQRGWISERVISRVTHISSCVMNAPLGLCLKSQGLIQPEQLKLLFNSQVLRPVCALFQIRDGQFRFEPIAALPLAEMTGLSMSAAEVILVGLRALKDWSALREKLPDPTSALSGLVTKQPKLQLNAQEWQLWEFVNGEVSLEKIAEQINISVETAQQIAFRLIVVGLAEEHFMVADAPVPMFEDAISPMTAMTPMTPVQSMPEPAQKPAVSQSFLKNLVGFLRSKTG